MNHLNKKLIDKVCDRLWEVEGSLKGLGGLFTKSLNNFCFEGEEVFGIGQLLKKLADEISRSEDILRCGYDSRAQAEFEKNEDDDDDDDDDEIEG